MQSERLNMINDNNPYYNINNDESSNIAKA